MARQSEDRLRAMLALLFLGLAVPAVVLIQQGFAQLQFSEFRRQQLLAEDAVRRVDTALGAAIRVEDARPFSDFEFALAPLADDGNVLQLSPLASTAPPSAFPGTIGYFQVDAAGQLSTPLLPASSEVDRVFSDAERESREAAQSELATVLEANRLALGQAAGVRPERGAPQAQQGQQLLREIAPASALADSVAESQAAPGVPRGQAAFDELSAESLEKMGIVSVAPMTSLAGELDALRFGLLDTGHFVLYRNAWRDGERFIQGMLIDREAFLGETLRNVVLGAGLAAGTRMAVLAAGDPVAAFAVDGLDSGEPDGTSLYSARLSPPLADIELQFSAGALARGPGYSLLVWTAVGLFSVLMGGFVAMYRFGVQQLRLARQQQNFVSAVSHELKTPLTSIRMYGEMLKSGWASEEKKQAYYDFIFDESERLSRLIDNVLQLSRLNQGLAQVRLEPVTIGEIIDIVRSKTITQAERAGFVLQIEIEPAERATAVSVDTDAIVQIFINLIDNSIKFASASERKEIVIGARRPERDRVTLCVRDYGPGIPKAEMKRLFELFYRPDNELSRNTAGTGIGLALVRQLASTMGATVDVRNVDPGAEFRLTLPLSP